MLDSPAMDVLIRPARERKDYDACVDLQREVWGLADLEVTSAIQLLATVHAGGLLLVAESPGDGVVGFCYAFAALRGGSPHLHSDMLAVRGSLRGRGVGLRLKWAQREEALRRGLRLVTWTFDPMRVANARLNLRRLGAVARELLPDFYGTTSSALHHGLATDRLLASWELDAPRVVQRSQGEAPAPGRPGDAPVLNDVAWRRRPAGLRAAPPRPRRRGAPPGSPRRLGRRVPARPGARSGVAGHRAPVVRVRVRARVRGGRLPLRAGGGTGARALRPSPGRASLELS